MSDTIEVSFEDLGLTKSLDKMTVKELRAVCMEKLPQVVGSSGMDKDQLVSTIKELFGLEDGEQTVNPYKKQITSLKQQANDLRDKKAKVETRSERVWLRRKINKLKKRTRRLAAYGA